MKAVYIVSDVQKALSFEWVSLGLRGRLELVFILIGEEESEFSDFLNRSGILVLQLSDKEFPGWFSKWMRVAKLLRDLKPDVVHTHLWRANLLGLSVAWLQRIKHRIYTRHHALVHYREHKKGRKLDVLSNFWATKIVAISDNTANILLKYDRADPAKVVLIPHGFDLNYFATANRSSISVLQAKYKLSSKYPVVGVIARYQEWKGIQYIIPAFKKLLEDFPNAHLLLANAHGEFGVEIAKQLSNLPKFSYTEIPFESDLAALYQAFTVYVHAPVDAESEAFGQTYVEALAAGIPSVFTLSGVAPEFIRHEHNALVVPFRDTEGIYLAIKRILENNGLRERLIANGKKSASLFSLEQMIHRLTELYES